MAAETVRRLACFCKLNVVADGPDGTPVGVGRAQRLAPDWLADLVRHRDGGLPAVRIEDVPPDPPHRALGMALFGAHRPGQPHRQVHQRPSPVHEGGWRIEGDPNAELRFISPTGLIVTSYPAGWPDAPDRQPVQGPRPMPPAPPTPTHSHPQPTPSNIGPTPAEPTTRRTAKRVARRRAERLGPADTGGRVAPATGRRGRATGRRGRCRRHRRNGRGAKADKAGPTAHPGRHPGRSTNPGCSTTPNGAAPVTRRHAARPRTGRAACRRRGAPAVTSTSEPPAGNLSPGPRYC